jgi:hypothetical protein
LTSASEAEAAYNALAVSVAAALGTCNEQVAGRSAFSGCNKTP